jgi:hypothetical protein
MRFMVVILGLAARRAPRWRHDGGLPGIAPLRLSGKKTGTVSGVGMIRSAAPAASIPQWHRTNDGPNRYDERESRPAARKQLEQSSPTLRAGTRPGPYFDGLNAAPAEYPI